MDFNWLIEKNVVYAKGLSVEPDFITVSISRFHEEGDEQLNGEKELLFSGKFLLAEDFIEADSYSSDACYAYESSVYYNNYLKKKFASRGGIENAPMLIMDEYEFTKPGLEMAVNEKANCITSAIAKCIPELLAVGSKGIFFLFLKKEDKDIYRLLVDEEHLFFTDKEATKQMTGYNNCFGLANSRRAKLLLDVGRYEKANE